MTATQQTQWAGAVSKHADATQWYLKDMETLKHQL
jgi:hypothetical protein